MEGKRRQATEDGEGVTMDSERMSVGPTPMSVDLPTPEPPLPATPPRRARRPIAVLGLAIVGFAVLALILAATATRPATKFAADTPEGAVQAYLAAWDARDIDLAYASFSERVHGRLTVDQYRTVARDYQYRGSGERRVVLLGTNLHGDRASLDLRIDELGGVGIFGAQSVWSRPIAVDLVREHGAWRLDTALADLEPVSWYGN